MQTDGACSPRGRKIRSLGNKKLKAKLKMVMAVTANDKPTYHLGWMLRLIHSIFDSGWSPFAKMRCPPQAAPQICSIPVHRELRSEAIAKKNTVKLCRRRRTSLTGAVVRSDKDRGGILICFATRAAPASTTQLPAIRATR